MSFAPDQSGRSYENLPRGYEPVNGGLVKRRAPPSDLNRSEHEEKRANPLPILDRQEAMKRGEKNSKDSSLVATITHAKRNGLPQAVTSTTWVTVSACPSQAPEEGDEEECQDEDEDYFLVYDSSVTSRGMLAQATSSSTGALYSHDSAGPSAPYVGE